MRYYSLQFRVGGPKEGFDMTVEVKAKNKRAANLRIRNRIRKIPSVATMPEFTLADIRVGVKPLVSEGHDERGYTKRNRPAPLVEKPEPVLAAFGSEAAKHPSHVWLGRTPDMEKAVRIYAWTLTAARKKLAEMLRLDRLPRGTVVEEA